MKKDEGSAYGPLVAECAKVGISRTIAFGLCHRGLLDTFRIGKKRYVYLASLRTLPQRLSEEGDGCVGVRNVARR